MFEGDGGGLELEALTGEFELLLLVFGLAAGLRATQGKRVFGQGLSAIGLLKTPQGNVVFEVAAASHLGFELRLGGAGEQGGIEANGQRFEFDLEIRSHLGRGLDLPGETVTVPPMLHGLSIGEQTELLRDPPADVLKG